MKNPEHKWSKDNCWAIHMNKIFPKMQGTIECCSVCGIIRNDNKKNSLICKGTPKMGLRMKNDRFGKIGTSKNQTRTLRGK